MTTKQIPYLGASFLHAASSYENIFTPEDFTDEHLMIANTARKFIEKEVLPHNEAIEGGDFALVRSLLGKAGDLGLLAHSIPEKYGGLGLDKITKGLVGEIVGAAGGYSVAHSNHTCIATLPITYFGSQWQKDTYLPKLASGEFIGAYCLTEPSAGSDALAATTTAILNAEGTHYLLNGTKMFITNASFSDTFIVYAKVDGTAFTAFIVEKGFPGLSLGQEEQKMGIKGSSTTAVFFENCEVPVRNLLGEIGKGHHIALNVLNLGRFNLGSACTGAAKFTIKLALDYTNERQQFGKTIASFTATEEKVADMAIRIYASESLQYRTAFYLENALGELNESGDMKLIANRMREYAVEAAVCKVYGSETLDFVADESLQLHGGYGFIKDYRVEQMYRDSRINRIFEGTNEINRLLIPMSVLQQAGKGTVLLPELVARAAAELKQSAELSIERLAREKEAIRVIRNVFLLALGLAYETFQVRIVDEQETVLKLADIAIALYAAESAVLRTEKAIAKNGEIRAGLKIKLTEALIDDMILEVEMTARKLISGILTGRKHRTALTDVTNRLSELTRGGTIQTKRDIALAMNDMRQYTS